MEALTSVKYLISSIFFKKKLNLGIDTEPNRSIRHLSCNRPEAPKDSPSGSTVPLPSVMSTPEPSLTNSPVDEWGTGVPSGAIFKSNQKSSIKNEEEGVEENDAVESESTHTSKVTTDCVGLSVRLWMESVGFHGRQQNM